MRPSKDKRSIMPRRMAPGWGWSSRSHSLAAAGISGPKRAARNGSAGRPRVPPEFPGPGPRPRRRTGPPGGRPRPGRVSGTGPVPGQAMQGPVHDLSPEPGRVAIFGRFGFRPGGRLSGEAAKPRGKTHLKGRGFRGKVPGRGQGPGRWRSRRPGAPPPLPVPRAFPARASLRKTPRAAGPVR